MIKYWLEKYELSYYIANIYHVWKHLGNQKFQSIPKNKIIKSIPGDKVAFFDDSPNEVRAMKCTLESYLFDPNGYHSDKSDIKRISDLYKIPELLLLELEV